ncbi:hypothetical protein F5888DRAFT_1633775 [Russula emetica]|nr:hypothetical protein F5888DRAFT_1633775 [Russula emetica]
MNTAATTTATPGATKAIPNPTYHTDAHPIDLSGAGFSKGQESSRVLLLCLHGIAAFCWAASRRTLERILLAYLQSAVNLTLRSLIANLTAIVRGGGSGSSSSSVPTCVSATEVEEEARALNDKEGAVTYQAGGACVNSKKVSWTYMRGVSLALSELCQDCRYRGRRIPLSAILDLMRQHQSAFVPLGPQVEKDVPKRLIQLANEHVVFFDPFEEYVIIPEETRQKYVSRRQELLTEGVNPADLSVFGAALTQDLSPRKRVTNADVASYKEQFILTQRHQHQGQKRMSNFRAPTREESLMSIADAIRPPGPRPEIDSPDALVAMRRGHSIVMDMAKVIGRRVVEMGRSFGPGNEGRHELRCSVQLLPEMSAIIHERDALEVENDRLHAILGLS